jgi:hypothetical protein
MATSGKGTATVGYNVADHRRRRHHLIVAHEVTNKGYDRHQLAPMALKAREAVGCQQITALADRGYFNGDQVLACENTSLLPCVPKTLTSGNAKRGLFTPQDFIYDAEKDHYTCPAGEHLTRGLVRSDRRGDVDQYRHLTACFTCPLKPNCTPDKLKRIKRWKHEGVLDAMQARLDRMPDAMGVRRQTVEHPFGTFKSWMGSTLCLPIRPWRYSPASPDRSGQPHGLAVRSDVRRRPVAKGDRQNGHTVFQRRDIALHRRHAALNGDIGPGE